MLSHCHVRASRDASQSPSSCAGVIGSSRTSSPSSVGAIQVITNRVPIVPFDQYHEPPDELPEKTRTFARLVASLQEEAEAIGWYEQRIAVEKDAEAKAIMENAQQEEFKHFAMNLEFLARRNEKWRTVLKDVLFKEGDIVEHGEAAEAELDDS